MSCGYKTLIFKRVNSISLGGTGMTLTSSRNTGLVRGLQQIEQLGAKEKRQVMQFLDTVIEREKLRHKAGL